MQLSRRVALDGVQLDEQHAQIAIQSIQSLAARGNAGSAAARYGGSGSRRIPPHRESLDVVISFSIVIKRGQADEREAALEAANAWARDLPHARGDEPPCTLPGSPHTPSAPRTWG